MEFFSRMSLPRDPEMVQMLNNIGSQIDQFVERKSAEEEVRLTADRLSVATHAAKVGIWDYDVVHNRLVWDDVMYVLHGISANNFSGAYEAWEAGVHPDDLIRERENIQLALRGEKDFDTEFRVVWPDKSVHHIKASATVQRDISGKPLRMIGTNWDITDRKKAELALHDSQQQLTLALEAAKIGVWELDMVTKAARRSLQHDQIFGYNELLPEWTYSMFLDHVHPEDRSRVDRIFQESVAAGQDWYFECRIIRADRTERWIWVRGSNFKDDSGKPATTVGMVSDITERKEMEEKLRSHIAQLEKSQKQLMESQLLLINFEKMETVGRLAAGVAHEVKNPLAVLMMSLDYLSNALPDLSETAVGVMREMRNSIQRADLIVRGLLDFSAAETLEVGPADLNSIIEKTCLLTKLNLIEKQVALVKNLAPNLPQVAVDRNKIEQVLVNLFTNAVDAMPKGGTMSVSTCFKHITDSPVDPGSGLPGKFRSGDSVVAVEIEDNGAGIPPEKLSRIYDPFFTTKPTEKGTGLGLTVSRKIMDFHGGSLEIMNKREGGVRCVLQFHTLAS